MEIRLLRERKKELGLTNEQLARMSGVSLGTVNKIFSGATRSPQNDTMNALSAALGLDFDRYRPSARADMICEPVPAYDALKRNGTYTEEDYYNLPDDVRAELLDGYLIFMEAPTVRHQEIVGELYYYIRHHIKGRGGPCKVLLAPVDVRIDNDDGTMLQPDLVVVCDRDKSDGRRINGAPDLVAEVVSPGSRKRDYLVKLNKYWTSGVREYWVVDPDNESVTVYEFGDREENFHIQTYSFRDNVPVGIFDGLSIDFSVFDV
ncbi:Uma2 family endonuclease [Dorea sp. D27]|uniref:Uma2 family endonuclease n=1 Tax=Dorea sp. D27 TaxID=658665 RepID=UPI0006A054B9|nr:Uma2 family endonuclease [Dorea sp. D27]KMZ53322.1 helix-turn-helix domain-containing protein [Dorea sp. D27]